MTFKTMTAEKKRLAKIALMALRCGFIEVSGGGLTKKGKGFFSPTMWRVYNHVKCVFNKKWRRDMVSFLRQIQGNEILDQIKQTEPA